jgi:hypothetical protein
MKGDALQYSIHGADDIHDAHVATQLLVENQAFPKVPQTDPFPTPAAESVADDGACGHALAVPPHQAHIVVALNAMQ